MVKQSRQVPGKGNVCLVDNLGDQMLNGAFWSLLLSRVERFLLLAKVRWIFLASVVIYGFGAGLGSLLS